MSRPLSIPLESLLELTTAQVEVALRHPNLFTMPELAMIREHALFRAAIYFLLASAYGLATLARIRS